MIFFGNFACNGPVNEAFEKEGIEVDYKARHVQGLYGRSVLIK
jgi:hypothetical protein